MMKNKIFALVFFISPILSLMADPPDPPLGKRWVLNEQFSDEFNGTEIDDSKWYNYHPTWKGRPPGIFMPSQVSVGGGYMMITGKKLEKDTIIKSHGKEIIYNIAGGAVISKTTDASFGYYECRFKAGKTTMSTTFWMSTRNQNDGPLDCNDSYGLELDFQECIGREGDFKGKYFAQGMNSNSHFWYRDCDRKTNDLRALQSKIKTEKMPSEEFYTYGGWWHNESQVSYYLDDRKVKTVDFYSEIKDKPFDMTMGLNLVSETYPFPWIELPNDEELADPTKNTCYYDWVRSYVLVDVDVPVKENIDNGSLFNENIQIVNKVKTVSNEDNANFEVLYKANEDRELLVKIFDENKKVVVQSKEKAIAGFGRKAISLKISNKLVKNKKYRMSVLIREIDGKTAFSKDEFAFVYKK